jgi:hypothetical protein
VEKRRHTPDQIVLKLPEADRLLAEQLEQVLVGQRLWTTRPRPVPGGASSWHKGRHRLEKRDLKIERADQAYSLVDRPRRSRLNRTLTV